MACAHEGELSVRDIATACGLSKSRVHQLLQETSPREAAKHLSDLRRDGWPSPKGRPRDEETIRDRLFDEAKALVECIDWLERLEQGKPVVVEVETERLPLDHRRVLGVLRRIAGDVDELARLAGIPLTNAEQRRIAHRRRFEVPPEERPRLSMQHERALLRASLGLDPWSKGP